MRAALFFTALFLAAGTARAGPLVGVSRSELTGGDRVSWVDLARVEIAGHDIVAALLKTGPGSGRILLASRTEQVELLDTHGDPLGLHVSPGATFKATSFQVASRRRGHVVVDRISGRTTMVAASYEWPSARVLAFDGLLVRASNGRLHIGSRSLRMDGAFVAAGRGRDLFVVTSHPNVLRLAERGGAWEVTQDYPIRTDGLEARAVAVAGRQLWIAGKNRRGAAIYLLDPEAKPAIHKFKDIFKSDRDGKRDPVGAASFGAGEILCVEILDDSTLAAGGERNGKAWVAVIERSSRCRLLHEAFGKTGESVRALVTASGRSGWTIAAITPSTIYRFRRRSDPAVRPPDRRWLAVVKGGAATARPQPAKPLATRRPASARRAVFPRVAAEPDKGIDTEILALNLGKSAVRLTFLFFQKDGTAAGEHKGRLEAGRRGNFMVGTVLAKQGVTRFDGYVIVRGAREKDLVLEGVLRRPDEKPSPLVAHWK
jgi:hypothetical protein